MPPEDLLLEKIGQQLETARYILERTYPLVKEEKLFVEILGYLFAASSDLLHLSALHLHNKGFINQFPENSVQKVALISQHAKSLNLPANIAELYMRLAKLTKDYKSDLISFKRHKTYVICTKDYKVEVLSEESLKGFVTKMEDLHTYFNQIRGLVR